MFHADHSSETLRSDATFFDLDDRKVNLDSAQIGMAAPMLRL